MEKIIFWAASSLLYVLRSSRVKGGHIYCESFRGNDFVSLMFF